MEDSYENQSILPFEGIYYVTLAYEDGKQK